MFWLVALTTAHPRVSGENFLTQITLAIGVGSSPRERGKRDVSGIAAERHGLIPA